MIGPRCLPYDLLATATLLLSRLHHFIGLLSHLDAEKLKVTGCAGIDAARHLSYPGMELFQGKRMRGAAWKPSFLDIVTTVWGTGFPFEASDPRDSIYGLLGLVQTWSLDGTPIEPDYSLSCCMVYVNTTLALLEGGWVEAIRHAASTKSQEGLPSWVPDFSIPNTPNIMAKCAPKSLNGYYAYERQHDARHIFSVEGMLYGSIECVGLRRLATPNWTEHQTTIDLVYLSDRRLIHAYFGWLVEKLELNFVGEEELRRQLYMLAAATIATCYSSRTSNNDFCEYLPPSFVEDNCEHTDSIWTLALHMRDLMMDPMILDNTSLYDVSNMTFEARQDLGSGRNAKSQELTPLYYNGRHVLLQRLYQAWTYFSIALLQCEPFLVKNVCSGSAKKAIQDGDVLARLDIDPNTLYIVRHVDDDLWELVSVACVPRFWSEEPFPEGERTTFRFC